MTTTLSNTDPPSEMEILDPHDREIAILHNRLRYLLWRHHDDIYDGSVDDADLLNDGFFDDVVRRESVIETLRSINSTERGW